MNHNFKISTKITNLQLTLPDIGEKNIALKKSYEWEIKKG